MRSTSTILVGALAACVSVATNAAEASPQTTVLPAVQVCIGKCDSADVNCLAHCTAVPSPTEAQVNDTNACYISCYNSLASNVLKDTNELTQCTDKCIADHYYVVDSGTPQSGGSTAGASGSGNSGSSGSSGSSNSGSSGSTNVTGSLPKGDSATHSSGSPSSSGTNIATATGTTTLTASASATRGASNAGSSNPPNNNSAAAMVHIGGPAVGLFVFAVAALAL